MTNESSPNDTRSAWQNQKTEGVRMSTQEIRRKAEKFERKVFWENAVNYLLGLVGVAFVCFCIVWHRYPKDVLIRLGLGLTVAAVLYLLWQIHKRSPVRRFPAEMGAVSCLDFYRKELERRRDHHRRYWWDIGPAIPGVVILWVAMTRISPSHLRHPGWVLMGVVTVSVLIVLYFWRQSAVRAQKLQDEINELDALKGAG
jgi:cell division protein FtsW (lipid II flippase)